MIESQLQALNVVHDADLKGKRVITTIAIRKGELVAHISGHREVSAPSRFTVQAGVDRHIDGLAQLTFMNHSCAPNVFLNTSNLTLTALRDLAVGDEVTFFYPSSEWRMAEPFACLCGAAECIRYIAGADAMPEDVLARYDINEHIRELRQQRETVRSRAADYTAST